jgi:capsular polysaccharide biosynthesis protein
MNENQNNMHYYENQIDLKDLFMTLWKRKKMIISFALVFSILTGMVSMFMLSPVYDTKLNIVINMPESYSIKYGLYTLPITTNEQYINLITSNDILINTINDMGYDTEEISLENLKKNIVFNIEEAKTNTVRNSFEVTVSADSPEESLKLAQSLFDNYIEFLDVMITERAVIYFVNYFSTNNKSLESSLDGIKEILKKNEELLIATPQVIAKGEANLEIHTQLNDSSDYVVPINTVNPNYIKIENDIIENKQSVDSIENSIRMNDKYLEELEVEKQAINKYYETGKINKFESSIVSVIDTNIYLPSPPVASIQKTGPSNFLNTIIGAVIGGIIGAMVALVKEYWFKES